MQKLWKGVVKMIPTWANYVARNEDGELRAFSNEPYRSENGFWLWQENNMVDYGSTVHESDDGFADVLWTDDKAVRVERGEDVVNHPPHYKQGKYETIEVIEDITASYKGYEGYLVGNVVKYLYRAIHKGKKQEDLKKAQFYLNKLVEVQNE